MAEDNLSEDIEIWKPVVGYKGLYEVSTYGRVRSLDRIEFVDGRKKVRFKGQFLKQHPARVYLYVSLCVNGKRKRRAIHKIVSLAFMGPSHLQVNHIDHDKTNNHLNNLEYVTPRENTRLGFARNRDLPSCVYKERGKYRARLFVKGKRIELGVFDTVERAAKAVTGAEEVYKEELNQQPRSW